jgi:hypothetical protein
MKINTSARSVVKIRDIMLVVLLATVFGLEVCMGAFLVTRSGHSSARQTDSPAAPSVSFSDVMAGVR